MQFFSQEAHAGDDKTGGNTDDGADNDQRQFAQASEKQRLQSTGPLHAPNHGPLEAHLGLSRARYRPRRLGL